MAHPLLLLLLLLVLLLPSPAISSSTKRIQPKFPAIFYFGDSIFDTGNNDHISTLALANHFPYGRDFPGDRPTGRFSNGRLVPDLLNERLQLKEFSPPYLDPNLSDGDMMTGVNFASAGSGFDERTSRLSHTLPLSTQVDLFEEYLHRLGDIAGDKEASRIVTNSLIFINSGTNDFTRYYRSSRRRTDIGEYQDTILGMVHEYVKELYNLGGRKFCLAGLPPFGCLPIQITLSGNPDRACVEEQNRDAQDYNSKLEKMLPTLQRSLNGSKIVYLNAYQAFGEILDNTNRYVKHSSKLGHLQLEADRKRERGSSLGWVAVGASQRLEFDPCQRRIFGILASTISKKCLVPPSTVSLFKKLSESQTAKNLTAGRFTEKKRGCCGTGLTEVGLLCNVFTRTCRNPSSYVFYDAVHPTERVYRIATDYILKNVIPQF